jgi:HSP20 family protein
MTRSVFAWNRGSFDALLRLQDSLERALEGSLETWWGPGLSGRGAFPTVNLFSDADGYVLRMEIPGLAAEDISIETRGNTLRVSGKRASPATAGGSLHRRERWSGEFARAFQLPRDLDAAKVSASYRNGVLSLRVPRREETKPRQIKVDAS